MQSYIKGEITITARQLASAKADAQKAMRTAARRPGWTWTQQDTLGFVFDEVLRDMDIDQSYDGSLNYDAARLITWHQRRRNGIGRAPTPYLENGGSVRAVLRRRWTRLSMNCSTSGSSTWTSRWSRRLRKPAKCGCGAPPKRGLLTMESYCKVAIMITAKELTAISAAVQGKVCKAVCDASEDAAEELDSVFFGALDEALGRIGIVLEFEDAGRVEKGTYDRHRQWGGEPRVGGGPGRNLA